MKSQELASVLRVYAEVFGAAGARHAKEQIASFSVIFDVVPTSTVSDVVKRMKSASTPQAHGTPNLRDVARLLAPLGKLLGSTAKASVAAEVEAVVALLSERAPTALEAFVKSAHTVLSVKTTPRRS